MTWLVLPSCNRDAAKDVQQSFTLSRRPDASLERLRPDDRGPAGLCGSQPRMTGHGLPGSDYSPLAVPGWSRNRRSVPAPPRLLERAGTLPMIVATHGDTEGEYGFRDAHRPISPILKTDSGSTRDGWHGDGSRGILKTRINPGSRLLHFAIPPSQARIPATVGWLQF